MTAEAIATEFGVTARTIYRDIATLQAIGAPVRGEAGVGYQLEKGFFLPPLMFDMDELEAIMLGARVVAARGDSGLAEAAIRACAKVQHVLQGDLVGHAERMPLLAVSRRSDVNDAATEILRMFRHAVRDRRVLRVIYTDLQDRRSERCLRPLGLTIFDHIWLLTAWCESRRDFRNFRADRFVEAVDAGRCFPDEPGKRFEDYLRRL